MRITALLTATALLLPAAAAAAPALIARDYTMPPALAAALHPPAMDRAMRAAAAAGRLHSLPSWTAGFTIQGTKYSYTLLGTDPARGPAITQIPTVLVPFRLTVPDYLVNGAPLVLDATPQMQSIIESPIFTAAKFDTGHLQFADAMLHAEFQMAPKGWHLIFNPSVAPVLNVTAPAGAVQVMQSKSGQYLGIVNQPAFLNAAFGQVLAKYNTGDVYVVFVSYNWLLGGAFGFHSSTNNKDNTAATVWAYNSWLVGVNDLFTLPSPDADTFAHEIAETVHDALGYSQTLLWGDWFNNNRCFQTYIEVGDAVEDAPARVQNYKEPVTINGKSLTYTLQTEALLPWFERQYPSTAIHGAYSFPGETALLGPAPFTCRK